MYGYLVMYSIPARKEYPRKIIQKALADCRLDVALPSSRANSDRYRRARTRNCPPDCYWSTDRPIENHYDHLFHKPSGKLIMTVEFRDHVGTFKDKIVSYLPMKDGEYDIGWWETNYAEIVPMIIDDAESDGLSNDQLNRIIRAGLLKSYAIPFRSIRSTWFVPWGSDDIARRMVSAFKDVIDIVMVKTELQDDRFAADDLRKRMSGVVSQIHGDMQERLITRIKKEIYLISEVSNHLTTETRKEIEPDMQEMLVSFRSALEFKEKASIEREAARLRRKL